jgi:hypothetical protein
MAISKTPFIIIVIVFAIVAGFVAISSMSPGEYGGIVQVESENNPSDESIDLLKGNLVTGDRIAMAFPFKTIYQAGESFTANIGIINRWDSEQNFYLEINQEAEQDGGPSISHDKETGLLQPGGSKILDIGMLSSSNTPQGTYSYVVLVCTKQPCSLESPDLYSSARFSFRII